ncbi:MAG: hypothetical protein ABI621_12325, partial [Chloroflexota bacterium]
GSSLMGMAIKVPFPSVILGSIRKLTMSLRAFGKQSLASQLSLQNGRLLRRQRAKAAARNDIWYVFLNFRIGS